MKIETTYRFNDPVLTLSSDFIQRNPNQSTKKLRGLGSRNTYFKIYYKEPSQPDDTISLKEIFEELIQDYPNIAEKEIKVLSRYGFDIKRLQATDPDLYINQFTGKIKYKKRRMDGSAFEIAADFMTVHKSKGLEGDIVIILNCNSGKYGFPAELSDDPVLDLLLSDADRFENGEERRLFYVAMTRAREKVYFVADRRLKSKFITEIEVGDSDVDVKKCPRCKTADLVLRQSTTAVNGNVREFYGCSNFVYGCTHNEVVWVNKVKPRFN